MADIPKLELTEDQKQQLRTAVVASARGMLRRREEVSAQAACARAVWQALLDSPTWSIAQIEKPDSPIPNENWSIVPTVTKQ